MLKQIWNTLFSKKNKSKHRRSSITNRHSTPNKTSARSSHDDSNLVTFMALNSSSHNTDTSGSFECGADTSCSDFGTFDSCSCDSFDAGCSMD